VKISHEHEKKVVHKRLASEEKRLSRLLEKQTLLNAALNEAMHRVQSAKAYLASFDGVPMPTIPAASPAATVVVESPEAEIYRKLARQAYDNPLESATWHREEKEGRDPREHWMIGKGDKWRALHSWDVEHYHAYLATGRVAPDVAALDIRDLELPWGDRRRLIGVPFELKGTNLTPAQFAAATEERARGEAFINQKYGEYHESIDITNTSMTDVQAVEIAKRRNDVLREHCPDALVFWLARTDKVGTGYVVDRVGPLPADDVLDLSQLAPFTPEIAPV
jgi:hypothetical protein